MQDPNRFNEEEMINLVDAGLDFYLTANRYAERFETEFAEYLGLSNALLLVNSGSSANFVDMTYLRITAGDCSFAGTSIIKT